jgi:hypothetical protein
VDAFIQVHPIEFRISKLQLQINGLQANLAPALGFSGSSRG